MIIIIMIIIIICVCLMSSTAVAFSGCHSSPCVLQREPTADCRSPVHPYIYIYIYIYIYTEREREIAIDIDIDIDIDKDIYIYIYICIHTYYIACPCARTPQVLRSRDRGPRSVRSAGKRLYTIILAIFYPPLK